MQILATDYRDPNADEVLVRSLRETGFAVLTNHPLTEERLGPLYDAWKAFFYGEDKHAYRFDRDNPTGSREGWYPKEVSETAVKGEARDLKEYFQIGAEGEIPPPDELADDILEYRGIAFELGRELLSWIDGQLPEDVASQLEEPLADMLSLKASLLRVLHYFPLTGDEAPNAERAAAHEDINLITLLPVSEQPGLQVLDRQGNWVDVDSSRGALIINTGDMLSEATDGYFPSTTHRVLNPSGETARESRIAIPFFLTAKFETRLSDRYTAGSYLNERLSVILRHAEGVEVEVEDARDVH